KPRIFLGRMLLNKSPAGWSTCGSPTSCQEAEDELTKLRTLRNDLLFGNQYALTLLGTKKARHTTISIDRTYEECGMTVVSWGPTSTRQGEAFNVQADDSSAFWFSVSEARGEPELVVGKESTRITIAGTAAAASFRAPRFVKIPGDHSLYVSCQGSDPKL